MRIKTGLRFSSIHNVSSVLKRNGWTANVVCGCSHTLLIYKAEICMDTGAAKKCGSFWTEFAEAEKEARLMLDTHLDIPKDV